MSGREHLRSAYAVMRAAFPRWAAQQDKQSAQLWCDLLGDIPADALMGALKRLAMTSQFPPTVAEIREAAGCDDPAAAQRRAASAAAASKHAAWVAEQERRATEQARRNLEEAGITPRPVPIGKLLEGIGQ